MANTRLFRYIGSTSLVSDITTGTLNSKVSSRGSINYGGYMVGGRINGETANCNVTRFMSFDTEVVNNLHSTLVNPTPISSGVAAAVTWRGAAFSNYGNKGYYYGGYYAEQAIMTMAQANDFGTNVWYIVIGAAMKTDRATNWGTTNPGTAGYIMGGYSTQVTVEGANGIEKLVYSTETGAYVTNWTGNFGVSSGTCHNGTTALYQMGGSVGQAGGYADTTRINKLVYSTETPSTISGTIADSRDLHSATQSGASGAAYCMNGRGGNGTAVDKMPFSTETCSVLASGHTYNVGNGLTGTFANHGTAVYSAMGGTADAAIRIDKWLTSTDARQTMITGLTASTDSESQGYANTSSN
jgi:hypothetical protein